MTWCMERRGGGESKQAWLWGNDEVMDVILRKKVSDKAMCKNNTEENKNRYKSINNKPRKAVS